MTQGTSTHSGGLSARWAGAAHDRAEASWPWRPAGLDRRFDWLRIAGEPATLQLLALSVVGGLVLGLITTAAWRTATDAEPGGLSALHFVVLVAAGAIAALMALRPRNRVEPAPRENRRVPDGADQLLAQMHHELRTPLTAMIGFSEVMLRELHGPLGNARYQEYAAHISESGGRLLKASEDALAVAAAMSALVADRRALRRERLPAASLMEEAWIAAGAASGRGVQLVIEDGDAVDIACDWQATSLALQHLLAEAAAHTAPCGRVMARFSSAGGTRIQIVAMPSLPAHGGQAAGCAGGEDCIPTANGLRIILARSFIEMQGATLSLCAQPQPEVWLARIAFPVAADGPIRRGRRRASAGARWLASQARRGGSAAAAAARASAGSRAAPRA